MALQQNGIKQKNKFSDNIKKAYAKAAQNIKKGRICPEGLLSEPP